MDISDFRIEQTFRGRYYILKKTKKFFFITRWVLLNSWLYSCREDALHEIQIQLEANRNGNDK